MKENKCWRWVSMLTVMAMLLTLSPVSFLSAQEPQTVPPVGKQDLRSQNDAQVAIEYWASPEAAKAKLDPILLEKFEQGGKEPISLYVVARPGTDLSQYLTQTIVRPAVFGDTQNVYGTALVSNLLKIAQEPGVMVLVASGAELREKPYDPETEGKTVAIDVQSRIKALRASEVSWAEAAARINDAGIQGWFDVLDGHKSKEAWDKGFDGEGVVVGVLDDGIDFAHPDLQGTYARVTDPASPYYGWPMAFSQVSMQYFAQEVLLQDLGALGITLGWNGSRWSETSTALQPNPQNKVVFQTLDATGSRAYTVPPTSLSGWYKMGTHPDRNLMQTYGERVAVLVVDENVAGVYDTVYVDLDNDYDFTDEKPATQASPEVYRDMDGDGYADISGGALVWISDGANTPPTADWLWGISCGDEVGTLKACPDSGSLVLFAGPFDVGYTHGTQCASNIAGQGVVNDGLTSQPFRVGGMVQGAAPKVGLMDFGNHYYTGTDEDEFLVAALGYDGIPGSGDEVQITSNSYGSFEQMWGSWGYFGRLITALNLTLAPNTVWIFSAGNEGPGYGPQEGDGGPTTIQTGSSTQYGSTNWDSIASAEQIVYGDPNSFYSKGPNRDTSSGVDVLANGGRGAGDEGLNYYGFNGAESWTTWGGTSRSGPVAAGNLALVYQAYKERYGEWPTWDVAKALLKSGATNSVSSPFFQGAGVVNADRATDLAAGIYGVYATPDEWRVGDWQGTEYLNFASVAQPGEVYSKTYTVQNPSNYPITVGLSDGVMTLMDKTELSFTTSDSSQESAFNFHAPDYLLELDSDLIPTDAEVMIVRYVHPYSTFDPAGDYTPDPNNSWRFMLYNWTDQNDDGMLWTDDNDNGAVNHTGNGTIDNDGFERLDFANSEIQEGEYIRMDYEFGGLAVPIIVHNPLERMADGYLFGWQHRVNDGSVAQTTFKIGVEFYKRADWDWLTLSTGSLPVPPKGTATFDATVSVPGDAAIGAYEGVIFMNDPGDEFHAAHETSLPVVVNVIADLPDNSSVTLGNQELANTMYQNSHIFGYFNWYGGGWTGAGDWRHYFLNIDEADLENQNLLIHTSWEAAPTDLNTWVLGPTEDCASNGVGPCAWFEPGIGQPDLSVFGPYTLQPIASSEPFLSGAAYPFQTSTGGPDDWLKVPLERVGLHEIALHNVVYKGEELVEQFRVDVGTIKMGAVMDPLEGMVTLGSVDALAFAESGTIDLWFTPTLEIPDLEVTLTGGQVTEAGPETDILVTQSDPVGEFSAWLDCVATDTFSLSDPGTDYLKVYLDCPTGTDDPDLFLIYDSNGDGLFSEDDTEWSDGQASGGGCSEQIEINNPPLGDYAIFVDGYTIGDQNPCVSTMPTTWQYWWRHPGALPTEEMEVYSDTVDIDQDTEGDPTTASYNMTVTTDERAAALNVALTDIPSGSNIDLYVTDIPTGTIVGQSVNPDQADEMVRILAPLGEYRFTPGTQFTIWVHGEYIPMPVAMPHLRVWWDANNMWLSAEHPDVHIQAIGVREPVSATLHFAKEDWQPGDPPLSARVLAGPSVLPGAFDELVTIQRSDPPLIPDITVAPPALEETLEIGASAAVSLTIGNGGASQLEWSMVEAPDVSWLSETPIAGTVGALSAADQVTVTFDATGLAAGVYTTTLEISSNDPDEPLVAVPVTLTVLVADLTVEPPALELALYEGMTDTLPLVVSNPGDAALDWTLTEVTPVDWLSEDPINGTLAAGEPMTITVLFDSTGLMAGEVLMTTLHISGSGPDAPYVDVPVTLTVLGKEGYHYFLPIVLRR